MNDTVITVLLLLNVSIIPVARQFDRHVNMQLSKLAELNSDLLPLGLLIAQCGMFFYAVIGWDLFSN